MVLRHSIEKCSSGCGKDRDNERPNATLSKTDSLRGRRTKGREGEVECEREARREREARSLGAHRELTVKIRHFQLDWIVKANKSIIKKTNKQTKQNRKFAI